MKTSDVRHFPKTRTAIIKSHVETFLSRTGMSKELFAAKVVDHFHATYPPATRGIRPFADELNGTEPSRVLDTNRKRIFSEYLEKSLPANLEESVRAVMDEEQRALCLDELNRREGHAAVPDFTMDADPCGSVVRVMKECTEAISAASRRAAGEARDACVVREAREAIAALKGLIAAVEQDSRPALKVAK